MMTRAIVLAVAVALCPGVARAAAPPPTLNEAEAARFVELALSCVAREYPNKIAHVMNGDADARPPRELTPAFFGCFDWHSSVHGHWLLARLLRLSPKAAWAERARAALSASLTPAKLAIEARYLEGDGRASFERPYGLAWLLCLAGELREWARDPADARAVEARQWSQALRPLEAAAVKRLSTWLPKLSFPVRSGEHSQSAFGLSLMLDWARAAAPDPDAKDEAQAFEALVRARTKAFFEGDRSCPLAYEPSGEDFLSPCLAEADAMRRALSATELASWLDRLFPGEALASLKPALVSDPSDPKLAHLDGLNLTRALMLEGIASALPPKHRLQKTLRAVAEEHRKAGLKAVTGEHYEGGHWLGSFAAYLVSGRGLAK
jgi:hypothetical protein